MFRILSIDGGGIKGVFPAAFLTSLEQALGTPIVDQFDLIAGTSAGGIIALGLALGLSPQEILEFYKNYGPSIFPRSQSYVARLRHYLRSKYKSAPLESALEQVFHGKLLGEASKRLVIPSFSARTGKIYVYKTPHHKRFQSDWRIPAVEVAMGTTAAPSYFPPYIGSSYIAHLDGGMWANNPTGNAVVEAIGCLGVAPDRIRVLSIGCTCTAESFTLRNVGMWGWRKKALEAAFSGQSFGSMGIAALLVGHKNIQRVNPTVPADTYSMDDTRMIDDLIGLAQEHAREELPEFRALFDYGPAQPFQPFYGPLAVQEEGAMEVTKESIPST